VTTTLSQSAAKRPLNASVEDAIDLDRVVDLHVVVAVGTAGHSPA
jgi:hypothetical protein